MGGGEESHKGKQNSQGLPALHMDGVAPAPKGTPQKVTGESGEQQGLQRLATGMHRVGKGTQGDLDRATTMSAVVSLLPSLCPPAPSMKISFLCRLLVSGPEVAVPGSASHHFPCKSCERLIVPASLSHLPRKENLLTCFDWVSPSKSN